MLSSDVPLQQLILRTGAERDEQANVCDRVSQRLLGTHEFETRTEAVGLETIVFRIKHITNESNVCGRWALEEYTFAGVQTCRSACSRAPTVTKRHSLINVKMYCAIVPFQNLSINRSV